jgi:hypothetical protein
LAPSALCADIGVDVEGPAEKPAQTPSCEGLLVEVAMRSPALVLIRLIIAAGIVALWMWKVVLPVLWPGFFQ